MTRYPMFRHGCTAQSFTMPDLSSVAARIRNSSRWRRTSRIIRQLFPICQHCKKSLSRSVHHVVPLEVDPSQAFHWRNLLAVCDPCHEELDRSAKGGGGKHRSEASTSDMPRSPRKKTHGPFLPPESQSSYSPAGGFDL